MTIDKSTRAIRKFIGMVARLPSKKYTYRVLFKTNAVAEAVVVLDEPIENEDEFLRKVNNCEVDVEIHEYPTDECWVATNVELEGVHTS